MDKESIIEKVNNITDKMIEEGVKQNGELDNERLKELIYAKMIAGLGLSVYKPGYRLHY